MMPSLRDCKDSIAISARDVTRRFGKSLAVDSFTLDVPEGETLGLVGPDGAGKTTILRMLAAVLRPTSGSVSVCGADLARHAESVRGIVGYMPQRFSLYTDLTLAENLDFFATIFGLSVTDRSRRYAELLRFTGLDGFQSRRAGQLSGGMQKKLALACTLIHEPKILLLDEPTTGVDPVSRREFWDILSGLRLQGITIVVSTPYMDEAERCTRVGLLYGGRLAVCDTPDAIRAMAPGALVELRPVAAGERTGALAPGATLRRARALLAGMPGIMESQTHGEMLHLLVDDAATRPPQIAAALATHGIVAEGMRTGRPRLEDAFISLVRGETTRGEQGRAER